MRAPPENFDTEAIAESLTDGWGVDIETVDYAAVGGGSYHWVVTAFNGTCGFVTVDDLEQKPWPGDTRDSVFDGLRRAFDTAVALRDFGLDFVLAPTRTTLGESLRRIGPRHAIALFPFVEGRAGQFGRYTPTERACVSEMLAELHQATPTIGSMAPRIGLELPGRRYLVDGLHELNRPWVGGPFSEPARRTLARHASDVADVIALADRLAADVSRRGGDWVITHGEPHAANVIHAGGHRLLIDWDTVALAPAERDLWMLVGDDGDEAANYVDATGHQLDPDALNFFRLTWDLKDLASFIQVLRAPHRRSEDTERAYQGLTTCVSSRGRWTALID